MTKTLKQIADELGVPKQQVYRCVKKHNIYEMPRINETDPMCFMEADEARIKSYFDGKTASGEANHETHQTASNDAVTKAAFDALAAQLAVKDQQIATLTAALESTSAALHAAQALHAGTIRKELMPGEPDPATPEPARTGIFARIFGRKSHE